MGGEKKHGLDKPMYGYGTPKSPNDSKIGGHFVAATGEFVGTFMFLLVAFMGHQMAVAQQDAPAPNGGHSSSTVIYISLSYGFSLLVTVWVMYRISGGLFRYDCAPHPAVTLGLVMTGNLPPVRGAILLPVQIIGGICAAAIASCIIPGNIKNVETTLAPNVSIAQGVFIEMFLTANLVFAVLMLAAEKSKDTFIAPIGIGLALFICEIAGVYYTGASLNPARSFGPCVASHHFQGYHWIYWVGPLLGALIAGGYYHFVKFFHYEEANPGQDSAGGDFAEDFTPNRSRTAPGDMESGQMTNGTNGAFSRDVRPELDQRIEEGTLHPGFQPYNSY